MSAFDVHKKQAECFRQYGHKFAQNYYCKIAADIQQGPINIIIDPDPCCKSDIKTKNEMR